MMHHAIKHHIYYWSPLSFFLDKWLREKTFKKILIANVIHSCSNYINIYISPYVCHDTFNTLFNSASYLISFMPIIIFRQTIKRETILKNIHIYGSTSMVVITSAFRSLPMFGKVCTMHHSIQNYIHYHSRL
jgi:hypothetical protein